MFPWCDFCSEAQKCNCWYVTHILVIIVSVFSGYRDDNFQQKRLLCPVKYGQNSVLGVHGHFKVMKII